MAQQLIYTSAPAGLKPGSHGYCTVAESKGLPQNLARQLESLSGYKHLHKPGDSKNPIGFSHVRLRVGGKTYQVISRVSDAGLDHTSRSNLLAQHIALEASELPRGGPAWLLGQPQIMRDAWKEEPRTLDPLAIPPGGDPASACQAWQQAAGDALWGGVLANAAVQPKMGTVTIIYPLGTDVLLLVREALALVPESRRWEVTFNTYFSKAIPGLDCHWRFVPAGTPQAEAAKRDVRTEVIDLTSRSQPLPSGDFVSAAQQGRLLELPQAVQRPGKGAPPESSGPTPGRRPPGQGEIAGNQPPAPTARGPASPGKNPPPRPPERGFGIAPLSPAGQMLRGSKPLAGRSLQKSSRNKKSWYSHRIVPVMFVLIVVVGPILGGAAWYFYGDLKSAVAYSNLVALLKEHHNAFENMNKTDASKYAEEAKTLLKQVCQNFSDQNAESDPKDKKEPDNKPEKAKRCETAERIYGLFAFNLELASEERRMDELDSDVVNRVKDLANCYATLPTVPNTPSPSEGIEGFSEAEEKLKERSTRLKKDILEQYEQCVAAFAKTEQHLIALKTNYPAPKENEKDLKQLLAEFSQTNNLGELGTFSDKDREQIKALQNASGNTSDVIATLLEIRTLLEEIQKQIRNNQRYLTLRETDYPSDDKDHNHRTIQEIETEIETLRDAPPQGNLFDQELLALYGELHKHFVKKYAKRDIDRPADVTNAGGADTKDTGAGDGTDNGAPERDAERRQKEIATYLEGKQYVDLAGKVKDNGSPVVLRPIPEALGDPLTLKLWPEGAGYSIEKSSDDHWAIKRHGPIIAEIKLVGEEQETNTGRPLVIKFPKELIKSIAFKTHLRALAGRFLVVRFAEHPDKPAYICLGSEQSSPAKCTITVKSKETKYTPAELSAADQKLIELYTAKGWQLWMHIEPGATLDGKNNFTNPVTVTPTELVIDPDDSKETGPPQLAFAIEDIFGDPTITYGKNNKANKKLPKWEFESIVFGLEGTVGGELIKLQDILTTDVPNAPTTENVNPFSSTKLKKFANHIKQLHTNGGIISSVINDYQDQIDEKNRLQQTNQQAKGEHKGNQKEINDLTNHNSKLKKEIQRLEEKKQMLENYQKETVPNFQTKILNQSAGKIKFSFRLFLKGELPDSERDSRVSLSIGDSD